eukprot:SAG22_NODE_15858_length_338_cov_1.087866_1_plen_81_part_01
MTIALREQDRRLDEQEAKRAADAQAGGSAKKQKPWPSLPDVLLTPPRLWLASKEGPSRLNKAEVDGRPSRHAQLVTSTHAN